MYPPPNPVPDIGLNSTAEELFISLEKMAHGYPLPNNVITDVNPYNYSPSYLPQGIWYLIRSKENGATDLGFWKVKGEASKLFSTSYITGWMTTLEFFEGQVPRERKTNWQMQEYWITQKGPGENSKKKETSSLCRVFLGGEQGLDYQKRQEMASLHIADHTLVHSTESIVLKANNGTSNGSTSKHVVDKDDETGVVAVTGEPPNYLVENQPEIDYFPRGDYLELLDLDNPASPSSSSDNSSCLTMSSDEYFDSLALLRELDSESNQDLVQKNENCKFSISVSFKPNEVLMVPASPVGSLSSNEESRQGILGTGLSLPALVDDNENLVDVVRSQKADYRDEGPSNSHDAGTSSSRQHPSQDGERKAAKGRKKKLRKNKYSCFMPFYFLF
ncbi:conserved hypothetical protein [Ricinus communis]|uniref:NAC domain-containing protein n=1 Tax=Ricinus communis TaxID=3988 RepID=B9R7Q1_RICCO|nr:conserved hypothetical protein [Ricinus communis]|eukprot:XP_002510344.1 NAC domain-containing protein 26 [Ricinus communis]